MYMEYTSIHTRTRFYHPIYIITNPDEIITAKEIHSKFQTTKVPPERRCIKKHRNYLPSTSKADSVSSPSAFIPLLPELPEESIFSILKRLPVKSILRFKCVAKEWRSTLSSRKFISIHREETSKDPLNHYVIIPILDKDDYPMIYILNVNSTEKEPISLVNPFSWASQKMEVVGSVNGLVCLSEPLSRETFILWNPAMNLYKAISIEVIHIPGEIIHRISVGFAYDSVSDDYKIIRIVHLACLNPSSISSRVAVYSTSLDSWKNVQIEFPFLIYDTTSDVIVNGIPYWTGFVYQANNQCKFSEVLLYYDMQNGLLKYVSLPRILTSHGVVVQFLEWKGNLGVVAVSPFLKGDDLLQFLVYDETEMCWTIISSRGLIELNRRSPIKCSKDGMIDSETQEGELMLYDPVTNGFKTFRVPGAHGLLVKAFSYTESLVTIKGMVQVKQEKKTNTA